MAPDGAPRDARQRGVGLSGDRTRGRAWEEAGRCPATGPAGGELDLPSVYQSQGEVPASESCSRYCLKASSSFGSIE